MTEFDWNSVHATDTDTIIGANGTAEIPGDAPTDFNAAFLKAPPRSRKAIAYEEDTRVLLNSALRTLVSFPATVPDAAAITLYGEDIARASGDLADADTRAEKILHFLSKGANNPYGAFFAAMAPLVVQAIRNHEPTVEREPLNIRVPFTKGQRAWKLRFGVKLSMPIIRNRTLDPAYLTTYVFNNPEVQAELARQGITVASTKRGD